MGAAVDDALWEQFAGHFVATTTGAMGRTKFLVYANALDMFGLDPIDVGAPLPAVPEQKPTVARGEGGSSLKIKVASVFDQASDREVERVSRIF